MSQSPATLRALAASTALIANRDFKLPADGWMQLFPFAEVPAPIETAAGRIVEVVQVLDRPAAEAVLAAFREQAARPNFGGILVDFDHFSLDPNKESRSAAWIDELQVRDDGMWWKGRITNSGRTALEGGDYRFISPVLEFPRRDYRPGERVRPFALHSAGLTNDPRAKGGAPISNRDGTPATAATATQPTMKSVLKLLGLADDASEESALAAVQTLITNRQTADSRATKAEGQVTALTTERDTLLTAVVEADLDKFAPVIANRDDVKKQLIANRTGTLALLAALKQPEAKGNARITNRDAAKPPGSQAATPSLEQQRTKAVTDYRIANRCDFDTAWRAVRAASPELFQEEPAAQA